jgi:SAM-dependent methyltransferase
MTSNNERAHGVTPELQRDYSLRSAEKQAAFILPYLKTGMKIIDVGCGPGTITTGLAKAVYPGEVKGIDHDSTNIEKAKKTALENDIQNISYMKGDALSIPFDDETFDGAFENNLFTHLSEQSIECAREIFRVLKTGSFFGARDADADSVVWGNISEPIKELDRLFKKWHNSRGSDITTGKNLPSILHKAGFENCIASVSADTKGTPEAVHSHAEITVSLIEGPFGEAVLKNKWADKNTLEKIKGTIKKWGDNPDSFFSNVHVEVIGWKTGAGNGREL